jgi:uncharacterized membrane protein YraQ (UPF0718 family)
VGLLFTLAFAAFTIGSFVFNFTPGKTIFKDHFFSFFKEMILFLPVMFILIGLGDVWISKEKVEKHIGNDSGIKGTIYMILLSMAQAGPLYGAFPVTYLLWKKGASIRNIFIYIGAFCTIKIPMLTFEIGFLGWKFSLLRTVFALPVIILIAIIMEKYLKHKKFEVHEV